MDKMGSIALTALAGVRRSTASLLELRTLKALDGTLAGASLRAVADGLFGTAAVAKDWHADGALRARVRRLVRRGQTLMRRGYRRLPQLHPHPPGPFASFAKLPLPQRLSFLRLPPSGRPRYTSS